MAIHQTSSFATEIEISCLPSFCSHIKHIEGKKKFFVSQVTFLLSWDMRMEKY